MACNIVPHNEGRGWSFSGRPPGACSPRFLPLWRPSQRLGRRGVSVRGWVEAVECTKGAGSVRRTGVKRAGREGAPVSSARPVLAAVNRPHERSGRLVAQTLAPSVLPYSGATGAASPLGSRVGGRSDADTARHRLDRAASHRNRHQDDLHLRRRESIHNVPRCVAKELRELLSLGLCGRPQERSTCHSPRSLPNSLLASLRGSRNCCSWRLKSWTSFAWPGCSSGRTS